MPAAESIEIRPLTPALAGDYARFFDATPHSERPDNFKCYCVMWCGDNQHVLNRNFLGSEKIRRSMAVRYVKAGILRGYLAYCGGQVVGWCNANAKSDCLKCFGWRDIKGTMPTDGPGEKIKSVFCFAIAPEMRRQGVAALLLERVCQDAARKGFDFVEAYPIKEFANEADDFKGPAELYRKHGFIVHAETGGRLVMRKDLKENP